MDVHGQTPFAMRAALLLPLLACAPDVAAQDPVYFRAGMRDLVDPDPRDTAFIVAATDPGLIAEARAQLLLPVHERFLIHGHLAHGDGGFNHNGDHAFLWHFPVDAWELGQMAVEVCDGRPYVDVDQDTAYWIGHLGFFCPWASYIGAELTTTGIERMGPEGILVAPNPCADVLTVQLPPATAGRWTLALYDALGRPVSAPTGPRTIDLEGIPHGLYTVMAMDGRRRVSARVIKE